MSDKPEIPEEAVNAAESAIGALFERPEECATEHESAAAAVVAAAPILTAPLSRELELTKAKLEDARYTGDNHHNAAACPHCSPAHAEAGQKIRAANQRADSAEQLLDQARGALAKIASATGMARCYVGDTGGEELEVDPAQVRPEEAAGQLRAVVAGIKELRATLTPDLEGLGDRFRNFEKAVRVLFESDQVVDAVAESDAIKELYGWWSDTPNRAAKEARQRQRYAQLAKKPGVQESWKAGARARIAVILAAAFPGASTSTTEGGDAR